MNRIIYILIFFLLGGCSIRKTSRTEVPLKAFGYDKVKITYEDGTDEITLKGRINIIPDSLIRFRVFGSLGVEVLTGKYDSIFTVRSDYFTDRGFDLPAIIYRDFGVTSSRSLLEYFLTFRDDQLFIELNNQKKPEVLTSRFQEGSTNVITLQNKLNGGFYKIVLPKSRTLPAQCLIYFDLAGKVGNIKFDFLSIQF